MILYWSEKEYPDGREKVRIVREVLTPNITRTFLHQLLEDDSLVNWKARYPQDIYGSSLAGCLELKWLEFKQIPGEYRTVPHNPERLWNGWAQKSPIYPPRLGLISTFAYSMGTPWATTALLFASKSLMEACDRFDNIQEISGDG